MVAVFLCVVLSMAFGTKSLAVLLGGTFNSELLFVLVRWGRCPTRDQLIDSRTLRFSNVARQTAGNYTKATIILSGEGTL